MDIESIKNWANINQGFLAIILFLASMFIGWISGFFKWLLGKFNGKTPYISAGGNIMAGGDISVGNKTFVQKGGKNSKNIQGENIILKNYDNEK